MKKASRPNTLICKKAKDLGINLTVKRNDKRVYKSEKVLKQQIKNKSTPKIKKPFHRVSNIKKPFHRVSNIKKTFHRVNEHFNYINSQDSSGWTELHHAIRDRDSKRAIALIKAGTNLELKEFNGTTPLQFAIIMKAPYSIIKFLINSGANVNTVDIHKNTPLHYASQYGKLPLASLLIKKEPK
jgi:ankyrin repeat protein